MAAIIADFGENEEGLQMYRINGTEAEVDGAIEEIKNLGLEIWNEPIVKSKIHNFYSAFVKIQMPKNKERENKNGL